MAEISPDELCEKNRHLELKINRQRKVIRTLVAYQQRIALTDAELDALSDAAALRGEWP